MNRSNPLTTRQPHEMAGELLAWRSGMDRATAFKTPDTADALRFAATEAAEIMDAYLREQGGYARANQKDVSDRLSGHGLLREMGQLALMLYTAIKQPEQIVWDTARAMLDEESPKYPLANPVDMICALSWAAYQTYLRADASWVSLACMAILLIADFSDMDLPDVLGDIVSDLTRKHQGHVFR